MDKILEYGCYYGSVIKRKEFSNIIITENIYDGSASIPFHFHTNPYFCYVLKGQYEEVSGKSKLQCTTDDILIHPAFAEHANQFGKSGGLLKKNNASINQSVLFVIF